MFLRLVSLEIEETVSSHAVRKHFLALIKGIFYVSGVGGPVADDPIGDGGKLMSAHGLDLTSGAVIRFGRQRKFLSFYFFQFKILRM